MLYNYILKKTLKKEKKKCCEPSRSSREDLIKLTILNFIKNKSSQSVHKTKITSAADLEGLYYNLFGYNFILKEKGNGSFAVFLTFRRISGFL